MLISVIVPVYNTEQYLPFCINSIINQSYKNIEIIIVNDGSLDGSPQICDDFEKKDSRISVIHQKHQGLVSARKTGVRSANGEYCIFVDSDDWISENLLDSVLYLTQNGTIDIVNYGVTCVDGTDYKNWYYTVPNGIYEGQDLTCIYKKMVFDFTKNCPGIIQSLCTKLIKKKLLYESIQFVDNRITMGEDAAVVYKAMLNAKKIVVINDCYYFYRTHQDSMCRSKDYDIFTKIYYFYQYMYNMFSIYSVEYCLNMQLRAYIISFIEKGLIDIFSVKLSSPYIFPFELLHNSDKKIVLYGAGNVGRSYYKQLVKKNTFELVAWVDKGLAGQYVLNQKIVSPESLKNYKFDKVLIAVKAFETSQKIKKELCTYIDKEKILWDETKTNFWLRELEI
ncbi:glycosyltransferase family 2 protein [Schaedlerella arabinosiphila]|uniref:Glycosyltransferase family 2 protein n=1 Tax=Schaedlerella arabinosiphila TaxID=2044587 RepID=A0A9X5C6H5_9FIRM|nr:glycosyltransferase family 2 protein [Schaedlerella arabinosiphila]KAI4441690.1 Undecaprenyl-phosphate 4-deoxy-4-formamido-L-arabinose transferase [Schaedlerella arabinosiphila]NDO68641.1 glycosyltransferase family 2 protein [Schaedlerella arabinosiphila]